MSRISIETLPRCGARTRQPGKFCMHVAMPNGRCFYHGGKHPIKHGNWTGYSLKRKSCSTQLINEIHHILKETDKLIKESSGSSGEKNGC